MTAANEGSRYPANGNGRRNGNGANGNGSGLVQRCVAFDRAQLADVTGKGATVFEPSMETDRSAALYAEWKRAVERSMGWEGE